MRKVITLYRRRLILFCLTLAAVGTAPASLFGQYYDLGRSPSNIRWNSIDQTWGKIVFPDYFESGAAKIASYINKIQPSVIYGFSHAPLKMPLILHTQNFFANGLALRAPRRIEFEVIPSITTFAVPWLKQLSAHEYRHAVQYGNLYRGWMKPLGYLIGEHSGLISLGLVPTWLLEGDAVMAETQMTDFGRALQPSFTIEYRAYFTEGTNNFRLDKWFCGSFRDYIPNHYQFGYQLTAWAREQHGDDIWDKVFDYSARRPYTIFTTKWALRKYYKTGVDEIARSTMADLTEYWKSLPRQENSAAIIPTPIKSYTVYDAPMVVDDSTVIVLKRDMDRPNRLVKVNTNTGEERLLTYTGSVSTPPALRDGVVYWSEYRNSTLWDQRVFSRACSYDIATGKKSTLRNMGNALYVTPLPDGSVAAVGYDFKKAVYSLEITENKVLSHIEIPDSLSVHGLAYDDVTNTFAFIGLGDNGMFIGSIDPENGRIEKITPHSRVTVYNLRAGDGKLSFNSIASGKDEIHIYDLRKREEYRLTTSRYGSVSPSAPRPQGDYYMTTYTREGYFLAKTDAQKSIPDSLEKVPHTYIPDNTVNPSRRKWDVINIDTVATVTSLPEGTRVRRYPKHLNLFNVHSWAPVSFDPFELTSESKVDVALGVTIMTQNLLSNTSGFLSYGYTGEGSRLRGLLKYYGLAPKFDFSFDWGGGDQLIYGQTEDARAPGNLKKYFHLDARMFLPMILTSDYHTRVLTPSVSLMHLNALLYNDSGKSYDTGYQRSIVSLTYSDNVRLAPRDFLPRWGYALKVSTVNAPFNKEFGNLISLFGRVYLPGILPHNSITLRGNLQKQNWNTYNFTYKELFPRGALYRFAVTRYAAASIDYQLPVWYPETGINSFLYFKRIRMNAFYDFARMERLFVSDQTLVKGMHNITSYGGEIIFDMHPLRIPVNLTSLGIQISKPSDRNGVVVEFSLSLPL